MTKAKRIDELKTLLTDMYLSGLDSNHITQEIQSIIEGKASNLANVIGDWVYGTNDVVKKKAKLITAKHQPKNYLSASDSVEDHLVAIDAKLGIILDLLTP